MHGRQRRHGDGQAGQPQIRSGTVTAIETQRHDPNRYNVFIEGEFSFGIRTRVLLDSGIAIGDSVTAEQVEEIVLQEQITEALNAAYRLLAQRARSEREVRDRLRQRGMERAVIDLVIAQLRDLHYLDDQEFARIWVDNRQTHRPRSRRLLVQELRQKGVDRAIVDGTLDETHIDEVEVATKVGRQRLKNLAGLPEDQQREKLTGFLGRKGFDFQTVKRALNRIFEARDSDDDWTVDESC
jgi:regulatory protein